MPVLQPRGRRAAAAPRPTIGFAGLQWRFVRIRYHFTTEGTRDRAGLLRRAVVHRRAGGRAEPVAPREDGDGDPGRGSDRADARRSAPVHVSLDLFRRAGQPEDDSTATCRRCASSCCAAARRRSTISTGRSNGTTSRSEMKRVFPDREIVEVPKDHPVFSCFYKIDGYPQVAGLGSFLAGPHLGEGRLRAASAHDPRRHRPADDVHQLEHRHGRRLGVVERRGVSRLHQVHRRWPIGWGSTRSSTALTH